MPTPNYSQERQDLVVHMMRENGMLDDPLSQGALEMYALGGLLADDKGRFSDEDLKKYTGDAIARAVARKLVARALAE